MVLEQVNAFHVEVWGQGRRDYRSIDEVAMELQVIAVGELRGVEPDRHAGSATARSSQTRCASPKVNYVPGGLSVDMRPDARSPTCRLPQMALSVRGTLHVLTDGRE